MSNTIMTIRGNIGADPTAGTTKTGEPSLYFNVGCDDGYWSQRTGAWVDAGTSWYSVQVFGRLAENARTSLRRGDAVIVTGRVKIKDWDNGAKSGTDVELKADVIGHDLTKGISNFMRRKGESRPGDAAAADRAPSAEPDDEVPEEMRRDWDLHALQATGLSGEEAEHRDDSADADQEAFA